MYLTIDDALDAYAQGVREGTIGKCPKCGSPNLGGLIAPDFESRRCDDCGKVSDQWRIKEGISAAGLSGETDGGDPGPSGGSTHSGEEEEEPTLHPGVSEADVVPYSGSGGITHLQSSAPLPWDRSKRKRQKVKESEGWLTGHATDLTSTGKISIRILDNQNLEVLAPQRILRQIEAYHFFEQFQILLPHTPMLNIRAMDRIAEWWRSMAVPNDLLEIDCTTGFATVTNYRTNNFYAVGHFGSIPTTA